MKIILPLFLLIVFSCSGSRVRTFPVYGNYCGSANPNIIKEEAPLNIIDFICQERLFCIRKNFKNSQPCDQIIVAEMKKVRPTNEQERVVRQAIIDYFD